MTGERPGCPATATPLRVTAIVMVARRPSSSAPSTPCSRRQDESTSPPAPLQHRYAAPGLGQLAPAQAHARPPQINLAEHRIRRKQVLGGLMNEYQIATSKD